MIRPGARTERTPTFREGERLQDTYRIVQALAAGGMGEVYLARHQRLGNDVAIKVLGPALAGDAGARARFEREAGILSLLHHPHIVQVFDFNVTPNGAPYLVMELLDGPTLSEWLAMTGPLPPHLAARLVRQIASALEAAHGRGIVHRDLKPDNVILLQPEGDLEFAKVLDFGICREMGTPRLTTDSAVLGTPEYMAPEQARGEELDARTDQFALATITYTLLTGHQPFRGERAMSTLYQVVHHDPPPLASYVDWPSAGVERVVRRGLAKKPEHRFARIVDFAQAFEEAVAETMGVPSSFTCFTPREGTPAARRTDRRDPLDERHLVPATSVTVRLAVQRKARAARWLIPALGFGLAAVGTYHLSPVRTREASLLLAEPVRSAAARGVSWMRRCLTWKEPAVKAARTDTPPQLSDDR